MNAFKIEDKSEKKPDSLAFMNKKRLEKIAANLGYKTDYVLHQASFYTYKKAMLLNM